MRFTGLSIAAMAAVAVADMAANGTSMAPMSTASKGKTYTTVIVTAYTTYCPAATEICIGNNRTITVKTPGTVTIDSKLHAAARSQPGLRKAAILRFFVHTIANQPFLYRVPLHHHPLRNSRSRRSHPASRRPYRCCRQGRRWRWCLCHGRCCCSCPVSVLATTSLSR